MAKAFGCALILFLIASKVDLFRIPIISDIQEIITIANDIANIITGNAPIYSLFPSSRSTTASSIDSQVMTKMLNKIDGLSSQIDTLGTQLNNKLDNILNTLLTRIPLEGKLGDDMKELRRYITRIDDLYLLMTEMLQEDLDDLDKYSISSFIDAVISQGTGDVPNILNNMLHLVIPEKGAINREGLLELIVKQRNVSDNNRCGLDMSFQYRLYKFYNAIVITEFKAYLMSTFALKLLEHLKSIKPHKLILKVQGRFIMRIEQYLLELKKETSKASREIYRCPIKNYVLDETYTELRRLFQNYLINVQQYNSRCSYDCKAIPNTSSFATCQPGYCTRHRCLGSFYDCEWIGRKITLCEDDPRSSRRYQYLYSYDNDTYYGQRTDCSSGKLYQIETVTKNGKDCPHCLCKCVEDSDDSPSIRTFSLLPQYTDMDLNMVVSDIRLILKDRVIHLQIEQSSLLPDGYLNRSLSSWIPLPDLRYMSHDRGSFFMIADDEEIPLEKYFNYTLFDKQHKSMNMDEISAGPGYVITGVRLNHAQPSKYGDDNKSPIQLEIYASPFDLKTGRLINDGNRQEWITPLTQLNPPREYTRERSEYKNHVEFTYIEQDSHYPIFETNTFLMFSSSSTDYDAGQQTVPLIDLRSVDSGNNLAISGIGLFYTEGTRKTGHISLKLLTIDISSRLNPVMTSQQIKSYTKLYRKPLTHTIPRSKEESK